MTDANAYVEARTREARDDPRATHEFVTMALSEPDGIARELLDVETDEDALYAMCKAQQIKRLSVAERLYNIFMENK